MFAHAFQAILIDGLFLEVVRHFSDRTRDSDRFEIGL